MNRRGFLGALLAAPFAKKAIAKKNVPGSPIPLGPMSANQCWCPSIWYPVDFNSSSSNTYTVTATGTVSGSY